MTQPLAVLSALVLFALSTRAQNLVANPGFETFTSCPTTSGQLALAAPWYSPNAQTPDYLNACSTLTPSVPINFYGNQLAHGGQAYSSIICYGPPQATVREYAGGQLTSPLVAGHTYQVSFWVSLADNSGFAVAELGAHVKVGAHAGAINLPLPNVPQVENPSATVLTDKTNWVQVLGTFTAAGGEDHIAVGNFRDNASTTIQTVSGGLNSFAVYYVDDVEVIDLGTGACDVQVVGWGDFTGSLNGFVDVQDVANCRPATTRCRTQPLVQASAPYAGGTAYDPRYRTVWVSDGALLAEHYLNFARLCSARCALLRAVIADPQAVVSGLCAADRQPRLFQLATRPGYMEITTYDNVRCPAQPVTCRRDLPNGAIAAGLAYDEVTDLLFVSVSIPSALGWANFLSVSRAAQPCVPICETRIFACNTTNFVTGLAFDACARTMYATDGQETQSIDVLDALRCQIRQGHCCRKQHVPTYRGLATIPCWRSQNLGRGCSAQPCPSCPALHASSIGDPSIGSTFAVTLEDAPVGSTAFLFVQGGACGAGLPLPQPYCGVLYPSLFTSFVMPPALVNGVPPCAGTATQGLPLPADPNLCGQSLCTQWVVVCPGFGFALSDGLQFTITGS